MRLPEFSLGVRWSEGMLGAGFLLFLGLMTLASALLEGPSYDLPFLFAERRRVHEAVIVHLGDRSFDQLPKHLSDARTGTLDWSLHAALIDKLHRFGASGVVLDLLFRSGPELDTNSVEILQQSIGRWPRVLMVAKSESSEVGQSLLRSFPGNEIVADRSGHAMFSPGPFGLGNPRTARTEDQRVTEIRSIAALCEEAAGISRVRVSGGRRLNYYGPGFVDVKEFADVLAEADSAQGFYSNKWVFVGIGGHTSSAGSYTDLQSTPYGVWPGVDVVATACLNSLRGEWLYRWPVWLELGSLALISLLLGYGAARIPPTKAMLLAIPLTAGTVAAEVQLRAQWMVWSPWLVLVAVQLPAAIMWSAVRRASALTREKERLERELVRARAPTPDATSAPAPGDKPPDASSATAPGGESGSAPPSSPAAAATTPAVPAEVPDYRLLRKIGEGAYGEVWLARDAIDGWCAVKVIHRNRFETEEPFQRELSGLRRYAAFSRAQSHLLQVLHVGPLHPQDHFYYVMELADDAQGQAPVDPARYEPRTLARELARTGGLPLRDCVELGIRLAAALKVLHETGRMLHRDVKPANVVFVGGKPKLADIGLVSAIDSRSGTRTYVGTTGYIPPEGPGTVSADLYALGLVIYEASTGIPAVRFPDLPATLLGRAERAELQGLVKVINRVCHPNPKRRLPSAARLESELRRLARQWWT